MSSKRKSCLRCAAAKAKCVYVDREKGCDRCTRLRRDCTFEEPSRSSKRKSPSKVEKLEEKVEGLLALLGPRPADGLTPAGIPSTSPDQIDPRKPFPFPYPAQTLPLTPVSNTNESLDIVDRGVLTIEQCDVLLAKFKAVKTPQFPFVVVPPNTDAAALRRQSPFLFLTVVTATIEDDPPLQRSLGPEVKNAISRRVIFDNDMDLEFLQGLIVHVAWFHYHSHPANKQTFMLLQMAVTIVTDLHLDSPPVSYSQRVGFDVGKNQIHVVGMPEENKHSRTADELRAFLGCYYLCSAMTIARKQPSMQYTKWVDQCCSLLEAKNDCRTDSSIRSLIGTRNLCQRVKVAFAYDDPDIDEFRNDALLEMSINSFRRELAQIEASLPPANNRPHCLMTDLLFVPICIHEVALYHHEARASTASPRHTNQLWTLLQACRSFITHVTNIPTHAFKDLPAAAFMPLCYSFVVLSDIVCLPSAPGWDHSIVSQEACLNELGKNIREKVESLSKWNRHSGLTPNRDAWSFIAAGLGGMLAWFKKREQLCNGLYGAEAANQTRAATQFVRRNVRDILDSCTLLVALYYKSMDTNKTANSDGRGAVEDTDKPVQLDQGEMGEEMLLSPWEDSVWQSMLMDGFSFFPPGPLEGYRDTSFATYPQTL